MPFKKIVAGSGPLVSADELHMLLAPSPVLVTACAIGRGFKYRNIFLLLCTLCFLIRLMFFPEAVQQVLNFSPSPETALPYLQKRGYLYLFWLLLYGWSYAKDWYFERVALVCFASEVTIFGVDYLTFASDGVSPMSPLLTFFVLLRCAFIACLLVNALYAHQAPAAPRTPWR